MTDRISQSAAPSIVLNMFNARNKHKHNTYFTKWRLCASQLIEEVTALAQSDSLERMRERYAQTLLTSRITYVLTVSVRGVLQHHSAASNVTVVAGTVYRTFLEFKLAAMQNFYL